MTIHLHLPRTVSCYAGCLSVITKHTPLSPKKCPDFDNNLTIQSLCFHSRFQLTAPLACAQYIGLSVFPVFKEKLVCTEIQVVRKKPVLMKFPLFPLNLLRAHTLSICCQSNLGSVLQAFMNLNSTTKCLLESQAEGADMEDSSGFRGDAANICTGQKTGK